MEPLEGMRAMSEAMIEGTPNKEQRARLRKALETWPARLTFGRPWSRRNSSSGDPCAFMYLSITSKDYPEFRGYLPGILECFGVSNIPSVNDAYPHETRKARAARVKALVAEVAKEPEEEES